MPIVLRGTKGSPLSFQELDKNFSVLDERLNEIENGTLCVEGLREIKVENDQISFVGTHGRIWGPFNLPKFIPRMMGEWKESQHYVIGDWVYQEGKAYMCREAHMSFEFLQEITKWQLLLRA